MHTIKCNDHSTLSSALHLFLNQVKKIQFPLVVIAGECDIVASNLAHKGPMYAYLMEDAAWRATQLMYKPQDIPTLSLASPYALPPLQQWQLFSTPDTVSTCLSFRILRVEINSTKLDLIAIEEGSAFKDTAQLFAGIINSSQDAIISKTLDGRVLSWNKGAQRIFGYTEKEMVGEKILKLFPPSKVDEEEMLLAKIAKGERVEHFKSTRLSRNGSLVYISVCLSPIRSQSGNIIGASKIARDITNEVIAEENVKRYRSLVESSEDAIICLDLKGIVKTWNTAAEMLLGYEAAHAVGQPIFFVARCEEKPFIEKILKNLVSAKIIKHKRIELITKNATSLTVSSSFSAILSDSGNITGIALIVRDITQEIARDEKIKILATHDTLTGCFNRTGFIQKISSRLSKIVTEQCQGAFIFVDIDNFKPFNDTFGHDFGDQLLINIVSRIEKNLRHSDLIARYGGDEFVLFLDGVKSKDDITEKVAKILKSLNQIHIVDGIEVSISTSMGIALAPVDGISLSVLLKKADQAMYIAKKSGKNRFHFFSQTANNATFSYGVLSRDLRYAIENNGLQIYLQPIMSNIDGRVQKAEVLVRWFHETYGWISPNEFIPIAEQNGLITLLGNWVLHEASKFLKSAQEKLGASFQLCINKSAFEFYEDANDQENLNIIRSYGLNGNQFIFEITENILMTHTHATEAALTRFRLAGIQIALDDFGTGYSSLAYLKKFTTDYLKIDKSFVQSLKKDANDYFLCEGIIDIAHKLKIKVVAEGIEQEEQLLLLKNMGCEYIQGFWFSRPLSTADFLHFMLKNRT